jgi:hypothetical protein
MQSGEYIEQRDGGYYVAGTRISLDSVVYAFNRGESPERILEQFPLLGRLARVLEPSSSISTTSRRSTSTSKTPTVSSRPTAFPWNRRIQSYGRRSNVLAPK